jgi:hypothetical protein
MGHGAQSIERKLRIADFEFRNWEPARRVGVRRTIWEKAENLGVRSQETGENKDLSQFLSSDFWLLTSGFLRYAPCAWQYASFTTAHGHQSNPFRSEP